MAAEPFYARLARVLDDAGMTDTQAGEALGLSAAQVGRLKKGERQSIRFEAGLRLCERLGLDPWQVAFGRPRRPGAGADATESRLPEDLMLALAEFRQVIGENRTIAERAAKTAEKALRLAERKAQRTA